MVYGNLPSVIQCLLCYRRAALESALRKKIECEKKALYIVEQLLEENITEEFLLNSVGLQVFNIICVFVFNCLGFF